MPAHAAPTLPYPRAAWRRGLRVAGLVIVCLVGACDRKDPPLAGCHLPGDATVLAIGDSLTRGHGAGGRGYPERLQAQLAQPRPGVSVVNLGVDGERSAELLQRIDAALAEHRPAVVLVTIGGNDFLRRVPGAETRRHLWALVERIRRGGAYPIVFGIPEPSLGAAVGLMSEHALFDALDDEAGVHVIRDVVSDVLSRSELKSDQIHPNGDGYERMALAAKMALSRCR